MNHFLKIIKKIRQVPELKWGLAFILVLILIAIFSDWIAPYRYSDLFDETLVGPSSKFWFGTDELGRDIFSLVIQGTRTSLLIGLIAALLSTLIGIIIGALSGFYGGLVDRLVSEIINIFMMTPSFSDYCGCCFVRFFIKEHNPRDRFNFMDGHSAYDAFPGDLIKRKNFCESIDYLRGESIQYFI